MHKTCMSLIQKHQLHKETAVPLHVCNKLLIMLIVMIIIIMLLKMLITIIIKFILKRKGTIYTITSNAKVQIMCTPLVTNTDKRVMSQGKCQGKLR